jgi:hypothetical protein
MRFLYLMMRMTRKKIIRKKGLYLRVREEEREEIL